MNTRLDDSSINSSLLLSDGLQNYHYFKEIDRIKKQIKYFIKKELRIPHDEIFLLNNSTHCLLNVIYGLNVQGMHLSVENGCYKKYKKINIIRNGECIPLITHISPESGVVNNIKQPEIVLDAAQSIGTIYHHINSLSADVLFFPLHKHLSLQSGVGILCVKRKSNYKEIIKIAQISESGTVSYRVFNDLLTRLKKTPIQFNIANFNMTHNNMSELNKLNIVLLTPTSSKTPFFVVRSPIQLDEIINLKDTAFSLKRLSDNKYRISCYISGSIDSNSIDCTERFINLLKEQL
ncbi:aminotransferase class V-fold PLP-dependent enzyme [Xenorhabdus sp. 18]|uniref:DUF6024 family protein n=1 Tax=Xenorhabdus doucetiae TaxID=351671 RepID=UPI0019B188E8|nr:DUF6024 family protein [Xenorhabdus sp. 18]MBD2797264.1 aminotransferase class V-fold PLP-dependent enzyme [Xenorhabdus sp. 18]